MPRKELREPRQIEEWLVAWGNNLSYQKKSGELILIGSAALLWHAYQQDIILGLPENSMDADPITNDECVAELGYSSGIGSEFEADHGWHINLMPELALREFPTDWANHQESKTYGGLTVRVPAVPHLLAPKIRRGEPRDFAHYRWAQSVGLLNGDNPDRLIELQKALATQAHKLNPS